MTQTTIVLGGGPIGLELATELLARDHTVTIVDGETMVDRARAAGLTAHESTLETAPDIDFPATTVVVATASDARNLLLASATACRFDTDDVVALLNDPRNQAAFDDAGIDTLCVATTISRATSDVVNLDERTSTEDATDSTETVALRG
jgi:Trk K+ transport system NAD-binding subunit